MGEHDGSKIDTNRYYVSCYGEKQILFNCLKNENHLPIITNNPLVSNIMTKQSYYNYKQSHSSGKYLYLDGKSGIDYEILGDNSEREIDEFEISFDMCMPINVKTGPIISNFVNDNNDTSCVCVGENGSLDIYFNTLMDTTIEGVDEESINTILASTGINTIKAGEYIKFKITYNENTIYVYKNGNLIYTNYVYGTIIGVPSIVKIGYNNNLSSFYNGFIKNVSISLNSYTNGITNNTTIDLPFKHTLQDTSKLIPYTNYGARFLTTPQLIDDTTNLDLYGNELLGKRVYKE